MTTEPNNGLPGAAGDPADAPTGKTLQPVTFDGPTTTNHMSADTAAHRLERLSERIGDTRRRIEGHRYFLEMQRHIYEAAKVSQLEAEERDQVRLDELEATLPTLEAAAAAETVAATRAEKQAELAVLEENDRAKREEATRMKQLRADLKSIDLETGVTT